MSRFRGGGRVVLLMGVLVPSLFVVWSVVYWGRCFGLGFGMVACCALDAVGCYRASHCYSHFLFLLC